MRYEQTICPPETLAAEEVELDGALSHRLRHVLRMRLMAAPLFFSGDMAKLDDFTLNVLCNAEVIEVDQDPLGKQAKPLVQDDQSWSWPSQWRTARWPWACSTSRRCLAR